MRLPDRAEAIEMLWEAGCPRNVVEHCIKVASLAVEIAEAVRERGVNVDLRLVEVGAILHDIGRSRTHGVEHGVVGGRIVRKMGLPEEVARIVERHVGAGITLEEAVKLGLPPEDYTPKTLEEKIVCYADKLIEGERRVDLEETIHKFSQELGEDHPSLERLRALQEEIIGLAGGKAFIETSIKTS